MKKIVVLFLILSSSLFAQKETNIWYFGIGAGIDFNSGTATAITSTQITADVGGSATICSSAGELLFYTNGQFIFNKNHEVMQNGENIGGTTGSTQVAIIVPKPGDSNIYYVFTTGAQVDHRGMKYTIVDMRLDNGLGGVTDKDLFLSNEVTEKLTAIKSTSFNGYWVVAHRFNSEKFMVFKVTSSGVETNPTEYAIGPTIEGDVTNARGQLKFSPNGQKLAMANEGVVNELYFFDFDSSTGVISNSQLILDENAETKVYGVEFSPSGNLLYVSGKENGVFQYNLEAGSISDIRASKLKLNIFEDRNFSALQIGPDGRIYVAKQYFRYLDCIENPDVLGLGCNYRYEAGGLFLGDFSASGEGFPQFIQSYFFVGFSVENLCEGNNTQFTANISETYDTISWNFGDGNTSTQENPTHTYNQAGTYTVTLLVTSGANSSVETQEVTIHKTPLATQPTEMIVCDDDNDGFYNFDLTTQSNTILNGQSSSEFEVIYYASQNDFDNNNPINNPSSYINSAPYNPQTIVASVRNRNNSDCEATTSFEVQVFEQPQPNLDVPPLLECDINNDSYSSFDLTQQEITILNGQPSVGFEVIYYASQIDYDNNIPINNPTNYINTVENNQIIVASVRNRSNLDCEVTTTFEIQVSESPLPSISVPPILVCDDNNDGFFNFNLKDQDTAILNGQDSSKFTVTYYASQNDFDNNNPIVNPSNYINTTAYTSQTIVASVQNNGNAECLATTSFEIQVFESPTPSTDVPMLSFCDNYTVGNDTDGRIEIDLTQNTTTILNGQSASNFSINYYTDVGLINQIADPTAYQNTNTNETIYVLVVNNQNTNCTAQTSFDIEVFELPEVTSVVELKQCDDDLDGFSVFNLTEVNAELSSNYQNETITFYESEAEAESNSNKIINVTTYTNETVSTDTVWARIENVNNCYRTARVNLTISTTQIPTSLLREFYQCDNGTDTIDGVATFDFSSVDAEIQSLFPVGQQLIINYYRNQADALSEINPIIDISNYQNIGYPNMQDIYVRVDSELDNDCLGLGHHITLNVETVPIANPVVIPEQCDGDRDGLFAFDTSIIESTILNGQTNVSVTYTDQTGNTLPSPLPNPFITSSQSITARVVNVNSQDPNGACFDETTINFTVIAVPIANNVTIQEECDDDFDGMIAFDTSAIESTILGSQTGMTVEYTDENGTTLSNPLPNPFTTASQTITARVINPLFTDCYDETTIDFIVREKPNVELQETDVICITESPQLEISVQNPNGNYSYEWTDESGVVVSSDISATITQGGIYTVLATSQFGCLSDPKEITIVESEIAMLNDSEIVLVDDSNNNSITIDTVNLGIGDYEFSLLDEQLSTLVDFQDNPFFDNLEGGIYTVLIRDKHGCGVLSREISLITFPKFFTPNNDGINDTWNIKGYSRNLFQNGRVEIFNRYGKRVSFFSINDQGWNGLYNGNILPSGNYWFHVQITALNGVVRSRRGYFSLLRK